MKHLADDFEVLANLQQRQREALRKAHCVSAERSREARFVEVCDKRRKVEDSLARHPTPPPMPEAPSLGERALPVAVTAFLGAYGVAAVHTNQSAQLVELIMALIPLGLLGAFLDFVGFRQAHESWGTERSVSVLGAGLLVTLFATVAGGGLGWVAARRAGVLADGATTMVAMVVPALLLALLGVAITWRYHRLARALQAVRASGVERTRLQDARDHAEAQAGRLTGAEGEAMGTLGARVSVAASERPDAPEHSGANGHRTRLADDIGQPEVQPSFGSLGDR